MELKHQKFEKFGPAVGGGGSLVESFNCTCSGNNTQIMLGPLIGGGGGPRSNLGGDMGGGGCLPDFCSKARVSSGEGSSAGGPRLSNDDGDSLSSLKIEVSNIMERMSDSDCVEVFFDTMRNTIKEDIRLISFLKKKEKGLSIEMFKSFAGPTGFIYLEKGDDVIHGLNPSIVEMRKILSMIFLRDVLRDRGQCLDKNKMNICEFGSGTIGGGNVGSSSFSRRSPSYK